MVDNVVELLKEVELRDAVLGEAVIDELREEDELLRDEEKWLDDKGKLLDEVVVVVVVAE